MQVVKLFGVYFGTLCEMKPLRKCGWCSTKNISRDSTFWKHISMSCERSYIVDFLAKILKLRLDIFTFPLVP